MPVKKITKAMILEKLPTLSSAVKAMCDGLEKWVSLPGHKIDMDTFGEIGGFQSFSHPNEPGVCFGCAATATSLMIIDPDLPVEGRRYSHDDDELTDFEDRIDYFRQGRPCSLAMYYDLDPDGGDVTYLTNNLPYMGTKSWEEGVAHLRKVIIPYLEERGL